MKRIAYTALFYGKEYLAWALASIQDAVDEIHILYTDRPSYGHDTEWECPDTEEELKREAYRFVTKPIFWHRGQWRDEGQHREAIMPIAKERCADQILVVDSDEVWAQGVATQVLDAAADRTEGSARVRFLHLWRSIYWACEDPCMPTRVINVHGARSAEWYVDKQAAPVFHFGYAQSEEMMRFKWRCHGHKNELRAGWFDEKFLHWKPGVVDVHPTNAEGFWTPRPTGVTELETIRQILAGHPNLDKEMIR